MGCCCGRCEAASAGMSACMTEGTTDPSRTAPEAGQEDGVGSLQGGMGWGQTDDATSGDEVRRRTPVDPAPAPAPYCREPSCGTSIHASRGLFCTCAVTCR